MFCQNLYLRCQLANYCLVYQIANIRKKEIEAGQPSSSKIIIPRHELWLAGRTPKSGIMDESTKEMANKMVINSYIITYSGLNKYNFFLINCFNYYIFVGACFTTSRER